MDWKDDQDYFARTVQLAREAMARGDDGFACVLVNGEGEIVMEQGNVAVTEGDPTAHDVMALVRRAVHTYPALYLKNCTVYALLEPCVMCMGAIFWAGIGKVKFAMSEAELNALLPGGLEIHSAEFAARSPKPIGVEGGFDYPCAREIVTAWVRSLGIPGIPPEGS